VLVALRRGHRVTAVVRDPAKYDLPGATVVAGDVTDAAQVAELAEAHDAVISAAAVYGEGTDPAAFFTASTRALTAVHKRLVVVGLSALLPDESGRLPMDAPGFPPEFRPFCDAHRAGLEMLRASEDTDWLYLSPAGDFDHEGEPVGRYRVVAHGAMDSRITYADLAEAILDEVETPKHHREHLAVEAG
ncbi:NAD(P)-dependent oxidoreductase, partial [Amycolatopsis rhizosphaerae]|uniref:NAD(P)-dependent oxidoreductase n=1 Tax=Amycolatopsis rhizosphaerae TaxID=2053003 RepID=UPI00319EB281